MLYMIFNKRNAIRLFFCCTTFIALANFESVCDKGLTIWTLFDLMQAVSMTKEDKIYFAHKTLVELLDFYLVIMQEETIMNDDQFVEIIALIDHLRQTFSTVFKNMQHDYLTCLWVILGIIEQKLYIMRASKTP